MAGSLRWALGLALLALAAAAASGGGWSSGRSMSYSGPAYYGPVCSYALPIVALPYPCVPILPPERLPRPIGKGLAKPIPAPARTTNEPPAAKRAPIITESRSLGGGFLHLAPNVPAGRIRVGFWNITGRDLTVHVDGQPRKIAKDQAVTIDLARTFVWQIGDGVVQTERVAEDRGSYEVILRP